MSDIDQSTAARAQQFVDELKAKLTAPNMRDLLLPTRAMAGKMYTAADAIQLAENIARAFNGSPRLPVSAKTARHRDGSLTIRITPAS